MRQYYIQVIADNYKKNLVDAPQAIEVHSEFLQGLDEEDFSRGYLALHALMRTLYEDIGNDPQAFGMMLKENNPPDAKSPGYTQSHASFLRVPNLLLLLGIKGTLNPDMVLAITGSDLLEWSKILKVSKVREIFDKLADYGFETAGISKTPKATDKVTVAYPECRYLLAALVSMATALYRIRKGDPKKPKELFYRMDSRILESVAPKEPKLAIDDICRAMSDEHAVIARQFDKFVSGHAKPTVKGGGLMRNDWGCVYNLKSDKRVILTLNVCQDTLSVKMNLAHIGAYSDSLNAYPESVREAITSSWECGHCHGSCAGGFAFSYEGKDYNKCRGGAFLFPNIDGDTAAHCLSLLARELEAGA